MNLIDIPQRVCFQSLQFSHSPALLGLVGRGICSAICNVLDLVFRSTGELTRSDMAELYSVDADAPQATDLLRAKREQGFQLLEINASYGARALVLFKAFEIRPPTPE